MHWIWWFIWILLFIWIFAIPYNIPCQRYKKDTALDILQKRFTSGLIPSEEYQEKKRIIQDDLAKLST